MRLFVAQAVSMEALEMLRSWSGTIGLFAVNHANLPMRSIYVGLIRVANEHLSFHVDSKLEAGNQISGGPGITFVVALEQAEVRFAAHSTSENPVIKILLVDAELTSGRDDFIEIGRALRYG